MNKQFCCFDSFPSFRPEKCAESFVRLVEEPHQGQTLYIHPVEGELFMKDEAEDFRKRIMRTQEGEVMNV